MKRHLAWNEVPGTRLVVAMAPAFTMGFVLPSALRSMAASELNGSPVAFTPSFSRAFSGPKDWQTRAKMNGLETLMMENSYSASPAAYMLPLVAITHTPNSLLDTLASAG